MPLSPELYCSHCQRPVRPIRAIVNYCCPSCGATFMATQIEQGRTASEPHQPKQADTTGKVAV